MRLDISIKAKSSISYKTSERVSRVYIINIAMDNIPILEVNECVNFKNVQIQMQIACPFLLII